MKRNRAELLAPAGSPEALCAAVQCGCDAVYLGMKRFSARAAGVNFSQEELARACDYCHERGVKVHLAFNTMLLGERELEEAAAFLSYAVTAGVDALIIEDLGALTLAQQLAPEVALHASTQCSVLTPGGMEQLKALGFHRMVLPRELSREEIAAFLVPGGLETEVFVHGALCMCVSGQCYYSAGLGRRSANRGTCAQPCRLPAAGGAYPLSLKDLSLCRYLPELESMGVTSFKIEGRLKRPEYVAAAVTACRLAMDGKPYDERLLRQAFSRSGFTDGYYTGKRGAGMFGMRSAADARQTAAAQPQLQALLETKRPREPLEVRVSLKKGCPARAQVFAQDGATAAVCGPVPEAAQGRPVTREMVEQAFAKLGDTPFVLKKLDTELEDGLFLQKSALNALRREALAALLSGRTQPFHRQPRPVTLPEFPPAARAPRQFFALLQSAQQLTEQTAAAFELIGLPAGEITPREVALAGADRLCAVPSRAPFGAQAEQEALLKRAAACGVNKVLVHTLDGITMAKNAGLTERIGSFTLNCGNAATAGRLQALGLTALCVTTEAHPDTAASRWPEGLGCGAVVYGRLPFMLTRNCPKKNLPGGDGCGGPCGLKDRRGRTLPLRCDGHACELLNPVPLWLADRLQELRAPSLLFFLFDRQTPEQILQTAQAYRQGLPCPTKEFTRGNVFRPVE